MSTSAILTLGMEPAPSPSTGGGGGGGSSGLKIFFSMVATDGTGYTAGLLSSLSGAGVMKVSNDGGSYAAPLGTTHEVGSGDYYYVPDDTELPDPTGKVLLKVVLSGYVEVHEEEVISDPAQVSDVTSQTDALNAIITAATSTITAAIAAAQSAIDSNTNTEAAAVIAALAADITTAISTIDAFTDARVDSAESNITSGVNTYTATTVSAAVASITASVASLIMRVLALLGENALLDGGDGFPDAQYNSHGVMTAGRIRGFASSAALDACTPGAADDADGELYAWNLGGTEKGATGLDGTFRRARRL